VIVDECHRGSAAADSVWRDILDYFSSATQIGMNATPKETKYVSNIDYFGKPIYTYSLKQGIQDGFLAPYKVVRINLDRDVDGWRPEPGQLDKHGQAIPDQEYTVRDFDRTLVIDERTPAQRATPNPQIYKSANTQLNRQPTALGASPRHPSIPISQVVHLEFTLLTL
jgi:type I restriction enzyme R subunit